MIGECESLAPRKKSLNLCNVFMSLVAGVLMIVACASFSKNVQTVQNLSFMVVASGFDLTTEANGAKSTTEVKSCVFVGLQGLCSADCSKVTTELPKDSPKRTCTDKAVTTGSITDDPTLVVYSDFIEKNKCAALPADADASVVLGCAIYDKCQAAGVVTMAFAVIGAIGAIFSMAVFAWRMNGDGICAKLISLVFSIGTFIACTVAFGAFQPCASDFYDMSKTVLESMAALAPTMITNAKVGVAPGVGGIMAVTSFVFFIYVMLMALFIPAANAEDSAGEHSKV